MTTRNVNGERIVYTCCWQNGCGSGRCIVKVHVKNGVITAIETDDTINANNPRENLDDKAYRQGMVQARACVRGRGWRQIVYDPNRLLYPMKRVGKRGSGQWERISWDEALDTIAGKMKEAVEEYGPYSVSDIHPGVGGKPMLLPIIPWIDFGFTAWGNSSQSGHELAQLLTTGFDKAGHIIQREFDGNEAPDFLNTKAIVIWGWDPAVTYHPATHYMLLAKERGIPIIVIDPIYSVTAEAFGSQWIPIRPGTDTAALLALAQVLFAEDIYDHDFIARFVEAEGFEEFRRYVMGESDGVPKTPEWAEEICCVPADTLRELARLVAKEKPTYFKLHWSVARKLYGESAARLGMFITAMTGNIGLPGTSGGGISSGFPFHTIPMPVVDWWRAPPTYQTPVVMHSLKLADAILLKRDLEAGKLTEDEYRRHIGAPPEAPLVNPRVVSGGSFYGLADINKQIRALEKIDFTFSLTINQRNMMTLMSDIILPEAEPFFETAAGFPTIITGGVSNYFHCYFKAIEPPGEARPREWIWLELARRFGKAEAYNGRLANVPYEQWDEVHEEAFREAYQTWAARDDVKALLPETPSWEEFRQHPVIRVPLTEAFYPYKEQIAGKKPFNTPSGKIEFVPKELRDPEFPRSNFRGRCYGGSIPTQFPTVPEWKIAPDSPLSEKALTYPLYVLTPHSHFRQHYALDNNPWFQDEFRHAAWLSVADAKTRGIRDGNLVQVYSDKGEMVLPAYVTSRVIPGTVVVRFGAWYTPGKTKTDTMPYGIDQRGASNFLTHSDLYPWVVGVLNCSNLVQVHKASESGQGGL